MAIGNAHNGAIGGKNMFCSQCGSKTTEEAAFCGQCGSEILAPTENVESNEPLENEVSESAPVEIVTSSSTTVKIILAISTVVAFIVGMWIGSFVIGFIDEAIASSGRRDFIFYPLLRSWIVLNFLRLVVALLITGKGHSLAKSFCQKKSNGKKSIDKIAKDCVERL
jgi:hypothetical protein